MRGLDGIDATDPASVQRMCERCGLRHSVAPLYTPMTGTVLLCVTCTVAIKEITDV